MTQRKIVLASVSAALLIAAALMRLLGGDGMDLGSAGGARDLAGSASGFGPVPTGDAAVDAVARAAFADAAEAEEAASRAAGSRPAVGRILGRVIDEAGGPVVGAKIELRRCFESTTSLDVDFCELLPSLMAPAAPPAAATTTTADGSFAFEGVAAGAWALTASAPGRCSELATRTFVAADAPPPRVEIRLGVGRRLEGRVREAAGAPVVDAIVTWRVENDAFFGTPGSAERRTDGEGRFAFDDAGDDVVFFAVRAAGFAPYFARFEPRGGRKAELVLQASAVVRGRVLDARSRDGLADVRVVLARLDSESSFGIATTGADGSFECLAAPTGRGVALLVRKPGWSLAPQPEAEEGSEDRPHFGSGAVSLGALASGESRTVDVLMVTGASARGRVVDAETGAGVAGATVRLRAGFEAYLAGPRKEATSTAADGSFAFANLAPGEVFFFAEKDGWFADGRSDANDDAEEDDASPGGQAFEGLVPRSLRAGEPCDDVVVKLRRGLAVAGVVVDDAGRPVPRAKVTWSASERETSFLSYFLPPATVATDAEGRFAFTGLPSTSVVVRASHPEHPAGGVVELDLRRGAPTDPVRVVVSAGAVLHGRLLYPDGRPAAGVRIQWHATRRAHRPPPTEFGSAEATAVVGADGSFRLPNLLDGEGVLGVHWSSQARWRDAPEGDDDAEPYYCSYFVDPREARRTVARAAPGPVEIRLVAAEEISGMVVDAAGAPVAGVPVQATSESSAPTNWDEDPFAVRMQFASTDGSGAFRLRGLCPGAYAVSAYLPEPDAEEPDPPTPPSPAPDPEQDAPPTEEPPPPPERMPLTANRSGVPAGTTGLKLTLVRGG